VLQGCAVIWSYIELFGQSHLSKAIFVDQAPFQNRADDWELGSKGCFDDESLRALQQALKDDLRAFAQGAQFDCCHAAGFYRHASSDGCPQAWVTEVDFLQVCVRCQPYILCDYKFEKLSER
jgi:hypothetical protein